MILDLTYVRLINNEKMNSLKSQIIRVGFHAGTTMQQEKVTTYFYLCGQYILDSLIYQGFLRRLSLQFVKYKKIVLHKTSALCLNLQQLSIFGLEEAVREIRFTALYHSE